MTHDHRGGEFIDNGLWNSLDALKKIYNSSYVFNLEDILGWQRG